MKTIEHPNAIKETEVFDKDISELTEEKMAKVVGGTEFGPCVRGSMRCSKFCCTLPDKCEFLKVNKYDLDIIYFTCGMGVSGKFIDIPRTE